LRVSLRPRPHIRPWFAGTFEAITLELAVISSEDVSEAVYDALPLIERCVAQMKASVLHRLGDGLVVALCELVAGG
jgi:hypothetical protein